MKAKKYTGGCLCGDIQYEVKAKPLAPHLCSCTMCQKWSGAPTVAWVSFPIEEMTWTGSGGKPVFYRSSEHAQRCFCAKCGGAIGALEDNGKTIDITIATLKDPSSIVPGKRHSFKETAPTWWHIDIEKPQAISIATKKA